MMRESDRQDRELAELSARQVRLSREITSAGENNLGDNFNGCQVGFSRNGEK